MGEAGPAGPGARGAGCPQSVPRLRPAREQQEPTSWRLAPATADKEITSLISVALMI